MWLKNSGSYILCHPSALAMEGSGGFGVEMAHTTPFTLSQVGLSLLSLQGMEVQANAMCAQEGETDLGHVVTSFRTDLQHSLRKSSLSPPRGCSMLTTVRKRMPSTQEGRPVRTRHSDGLMLTLARSFLEIHVPAPSFFSCRQPNCWCLHTTKHDHLRTWFQIPKLPEDPK